MARVKQPIIAQPKSAVNLGPQARPAAAPVAPTTAVDIDEKFAAEFEKIIKAVEVNADTASGLDTFDFASNMLSTFVQSKFAQTEQARRELEDRWLRDLRQYRGIYEADQLARMNQNRSKAFIRATRTKVKTVTSRLTDLLFPANGDKNWGISSTPMPDYTDAQVKQLLTMYQQETGQNISGPELELLVKQTSDTKVARMEKIMEDQLSDLQYRTILRDVLQSGNIYGTGILKGPMVSIESNRQYRKNKEEDGSERWILQEFDEVTPYIESVSVWDVYPDMEAVTVDNCRHIIQRRVMDKHRLVQLSERSDFSGDKIRNYLRANPAGNHQKKHFELDILAIGGQFATGNANTVGSKKYEVLEFWGYVDAEDLIAVGVDVPDKLRGQLELFSNVWVLGNEVIKASLAPLDGVRWPFYFYYYDHDETSIFGTGIPTIMRDPQELLNSGFRAMLDNAAISCGPQIEANMEYLSEDEDPTDIRPFKVWLRTGSGPDAANPALRVFELPSYTPQFIQMIELFEKYGDEVTTIPRYMWGESAGGGAGRTASGLSMMMGSANATIKDQVKNFDDGITKPFVTALYHWNMQFHDDENAKGDYSIVARGTSSLIAKEIYSQSLMNFANITNNPADAPIVKRANLIRSIAESLDLGDKNFVYSDKEISVQQQQAQQQQAEERNWMTQLIETAREYGISPEDLANSMKQAKVSLDDRANQNIQQAQQMNGQSTN